MSLSCFLFSPVLIFYFVLVLLISIGIQVSFPCSVEIQLRFLSGGGQNYSHEPEFCCFQAAFKLTIWVCFTFTYRCERPLPFFPSALSPSSTPTPSLLPVLLFLTHTHVRALLLLPTPSLSPPLPPPPPTTTTTHRAHCAHVPCP